MKFIALTTPNNIVPWKYVTDHVSHIARGEQGDKKQGVQTAMKIYLYMRKKASSLSLNAREVLLIQESP